MVAVNDRWQVIVTREGRDWLAEVVGIRGGAHTHARTLDKLDQYVREVIVLGADLPDEALERLDLDYEYRVADADDAERREAVDIRKRAEELHARAIQAASQLALRYTERGLPVRDIATMLGISHQRVSQLASAATAGQVRPGSAQERGREIRDAKKSRQGRLVTSQDTRRSA
jgi:predicted transcriptional regulator